MTLVKKISVKKRFNRVGTCNGHIAKAFSILENDQRRLYKTFKDVSFFTQTLGVLPNNTTINALGHVFRQLGSLAATFNRFLVFTQSVINEPSSLAIIA